MRVSVLMPAFEQAAFLGRAVASLQAQEVEDWELVVVDDGSHDHTAAVAEALAAADARIRVLRRAGNGGLGAALNDALDAARAPVVAYLPCDDVLHADHLTVLLAALDGTPGAVLAVADLADGPDVAPPPARGALQLVQLAHRRTSDRWATRDEVESDDLDLLFLARLGTRGAAVLTGRATCRFTAHPGQRHRALLERHDGGLNVFRRRYRVGTPLRLRTSDGAEVDEVARYARFRDRAPTPRAPDGLRILLVGELAYNPERVLALEERGHELLGLWTSDGLGFNTVGPLPFGHVRDLPRDGWRDAVRAARPDVVYALLNWRAVSLAHAVLAAGLGLPFAWHYKEAPQRSMLRGEWPLLADLHERSDGRIYATEEERAFFEAALPGRADPARTLVLDGDLPKREWLDAGPRSTRLSAADGAAHLAVLGRPVGLSPSDAGALAARGVHVHVHGLRRAPGMADGWLQAAAAAAGDRLHLEDAVGPEDWVRVLSRYDAGWMHRHRSANGGDLRAAAWEDLNVPARVPTLLAAGVPLAQPSNPGHVVHVERLVRATGAGLLYASLDDLAAQLHAEVRGGHPASERAWAVRDDFTFDAHADRLIAFLRGLVRGS